MATPSFTEGSYCGQGDTPLPGRPSDPNNRTVVIQQNYIADGATINISSNNSSGTTVTRLGQAVAQPVEPTFLPRPLTRQLAPVEYGRDGVVVINGNTIGNYAVINIASSHSTGALNQTVLPSPGRTRNWTRNWTRNRTKNRTTNF